ncbi:MAG: hypothetical protein GSR85_02580 [Desulfurococcales archaeon]|nr:hypothetical protein [Desulfurococcales archaeon]
MGLAQKGAIIIISAWILYEIVMAVRLRETFTPGDYVALALKLAYLIPLLYNTIIDPGKTLYYASRISPIMATAVRSSNGWLAYTLFPVIVTLLGVGASLFLYRRNRSRGHTASAIINALATILYSIGLIGALYEKPITIRGDALLGLIVVYPLALSSILKEDSPIYKLLSLSPVLSISSWIL